MFLAAFTSALPVCPQARQRKTAWLSARLPVHGPAGRAALRRVRRVNGDYAARSLVLQPPGRRPPSDGADAPVQLRLRLHTPPRLGRGPAGRCGHRPDVQRFQSDRVESAGQSGTGLLDPVLAPVGFAGMHPPHGRFHPVPPPRTTSAARQAPLQPPQPTSLRRTQPCDGQQFAGGQGSGHGHATVDTHGGTVAGGGDRIGHGGEGEVPAAGAVLRHAVRLHPVGHRPGQAEAHPPGLGYPHLGRMAAQSPNALRLDRNNPEALVPPGLAPGGAAMCAGEVVRHRLGEVPQCLLLHHL